MMNCRSCGCCIERCRYTLRSSTRRICKARRRLGASWRPVRRELFRYLNSRRGGRAPVRIGQILTPCTLDIGQIRVISHSESGLTCYRARSPSFTPRCTYCTCTSGPRIVRDEFVALLRPRVNKRRNGSNGNLKRSNRGGEFG